MAPKGKMSAKKSRSKSYINVWGQIFESETSTKISGIGDGEGEGLHFRTLKTQYGDSVIFHKGVALVKE